MGSAEILTTDAIADLDAGAVLLAGTNRLARGLRHEYNRAMEEGGRTAWESPTVSTALSWLRELWQDELAFTDTGVGHRALLTKEQETAVWERVIREWCKRSERKLIQIEAAADSARSAYRLQYDWHLPEPTEKDHPVDDVRAFMGWKNDFDAWCGDNGWISESRLMESVAVAFRNSVLHPPPGVLLAGFEEVTPALEDLLQALSDVEVPVHRLESAPREASVRMAACRTPADEIAACVVWVRKQLEADPAQKLGIVVPDLGDRRAEIARVFEDVLSPESVLPGAQPGRHVNFSLGPPLSSYPVVASALNALKLLNGDIELNQLGSLLRSPFLGEGDAEAQKRALLDVSLRRFGERSVRIPWLIEVAGEQRNGRLDQSPRLASRLKRLQGFMKELPSKAGPTVWAQSFENALTILGWPGERMLDSAEHQARNRWSRLIDAFAGLEAMVPAMTLRTAIGRLRRMASATTFQPESAAAPVQILGLLEATGAQFDAIWVMGLTDTTLPGLPHTHPLLPSELQRARGLPHSTPERELEFALRRLRGLTSAAPEVILSYPQMDGDNENVASPLLNVYHVNEFDQAECRYPSYASRILDSVPEGGLEEVEDHQAPPLEPARRASGGSGPLTSQSACPFQAFARHRLHAERLEEPQDGLDARDRGGLVHNALQKLWEEIRDRDTLLGMSAETLEDLIKRVVDEAVNDLREKRPTTLTPTFSALQKRAIERLLAGWVEQETERSTFRVVETEKELREQQIGPLTIRRLVVDRIDELEEGGRVVVDYKTGRGKSRNAWRGERPDEPQLPLYATLTDGDVGGVVFANVKADKPGWSGLMRDDAVIKRDKAYPSGNSRSEWEALYPDWQALLAGWRRDLEALAEGFVAGDARVDPKNPRHTCTFCHLSAACRIAELTERADGALIGFMDPDNDE